jgi:hypothetical protein
LYRSIQHCSRRKLKSGGPTCHVALIRRLFQVEVDETASGSVKKGADCLSAFALVEQMLERFGGHSAAAVTETGADTAVSVCRRTMAFPPQCAPRAHTPHISPHCLHTAICMGAQSCWPHNAQRLEMGPYESTEQTVALNQSIRRSSSMPSVTSPIWLRADLPAQRQLHPRPLTILVRGTASGGRTRGGRHRTCVAGCPRCAAAAEGKAAALARRPAVGAAHRGGHSAAAAPRACALCRRRHSAGRGARRSETHDATRMAACG